MTGGARKWNRATFGFPMKWGMEGSHCEEILGVTKEASNLYCSWVENGSWTLGGQIPPLFLTSSVIDIRTPVLLFGNNLHICANVFSGFALVHWTGLPGSETLHLGLDGVERGRAVPTGRASGRRSRGRVTLHAGVRACAVISLCVCPSTSIRSLARGIMYGAACRWRPPKTLRTAGAAHTHTRTWDFRRNVHVRIMDGSVSRFATMHAAANTNIFKLSSKSR
jgi:hypothetical protein